MHPVKVLMKKKPLVYFVVVISSFISPYLVVDASASQVTPEFNYPSKKYEKLLKSSRSSGELTKLNIDSEKLAKNIMTWQLDTGGFSVHDHQRYLKEWDGQERRSVFRNKVAKDVFQDLANFDDLATISELRFLAQVYKYTSDLELKTNIQKSVDRTLRFIFAAQHPAGSWPQVFPQRLKPTYSNNATINDGVMTRIMVLLADIRAGVAPFDSDLVLELRVNEIDQRLVRAMQSLLAAQINSGGVPTIWPAQYDPVSFAPQSARKYEAPGKVSRESAEVVAVMLNWPFASARVEQAAEQALTWFRKNALDGRIYDKSIGSVVPLPGKKLWYRYYELDKDVPFFGDREKGKVTSLQEVGMERRTGYSWAGNWADKLLKLTLDDSRFAKTQ